MYRFPRSFLLVLAFVLLLPTLASAQVVRLQSDIFSQYRSDSRFDLASQPEANDRIGSALATGDFDGDGYQDLAIGCAFEDDGTSTNQVVDAGWVTVIYGRPDGLDASPGVEDIPWDQGGDVEGGTESGDRIGFSVAVGDFNGDGFDDMVMGSPGEDITIGGVTDNGAGSINVLYGSFEGLQIVGNRQFYQEREINGHTVPGASEAGDAFGTSLAVGDFDGDGRDDLAVGLPFEDITSIDDAGGVIILYGKPIIGLDPERSIYIARDTPGTLGSPSPFDNFGQALAAGDFDGDGHDDLAVGVPNDSQAVGNAGSVDLFFGSPAGIDVATNEIWNLNTAFVVGAGMPGDSFGESLASGNFDGDAYDDLAIGLPDRDFNNTLFEHGAVSVIYGSDTGLTAMGSQIFQQGSGGLAGMIEDDDNFGQSLAVGDVDGNGADDLLIGIPGEPVMVGGNLRDGAGAAQLIFGTVGVGLEIGPEPPFDYGLVGNAALSDGFGSKVTLGDFDRDGKDDLAFAIPRRLVQDANGNSISAAGEIVVSRTGGIFSDDFESGTLDAWTAVVP